jgi:hypothetical protein
MQAVFSIQDLRQMLLCIPLFGQYLAHLKNKTTKTNYRKAFADAKAFGLLKVYNDFRQQQH